MGCVATAPNTIDATTDNGVEEKKKVESETPNNEYVGDAPDDDDPNKPAWKILGNGIGKDEMYIVPRNFKLLEELEFSEKGLVNESEFAKKFPNDINYVNYGLEGMDETLSCWNASIIPIQNTPIGTRFYQVKMITGQGYPWDPPFMTFIQKVQLPFVDPDGTVQITKIPNFTWDREKTMLELLIAIRHGMNQGTAAKDCAKIKEGTIY